MKIDTNEVLRDVWGKPILETPPQGEKAGVELTLGMLCTSSFLTPTKADLDVTGVDEKMKIYRFAKKFADGGVVELTVDELAEVRRRVARVYQAALAGPALELLDVKPSS